ncbi:hypothetical protein GCM10010168_26890 [Actinoplanes ianthinogenes]|uniref:Sulfotransferase family protein n=1 Tax=Actinoplanes ianthinogenes TaxID=122358 RepID=A0ABN6C5H8_9ACTN|nr:hypothetical protein [Actinoplanes ianthinogenes]BCJ39829.1 hypothetical protein Aiant_04860 [Actinoplanes ianthinogenes]GGR08428.1 hypothetical protein GCM10010168_26890 [Actinoplanes ianthinogenes]
MTRRVFVHVGAPKTGSTFIQNVLWKNRDTLKRAGTLLPATRGQQDQAMTDLREVSWRDKDATWTWDMLAEQAAKWPGDVIITNEGLGGATVAQAARAVRSLAPAEVHVIVVGRDLWRTLPSMWQENVKSRSIGSFENFLSAIERGKNDAFWNHTANRMLRHWGDQVPPERRHLITVPPPGSPHILLWERFAGVVGIPDGLCEIPGESANASLGAAEIELLRRLNRQLGDRFPYRTAYRKYVLQHLVGPVLKQGRNELRFGIGMDRADWILALTEERIKELQEYPCTVVGDLDELRPVGLRETVSPDEVTDEQVLEAAIEALIGMIEYSDGLHERANRDIVTRIKGRVARQVGLKRQ